jgi:hypothetical protein
MAAPTPSAKVLTRVSTVISTDGILPSNGTAPMNSTLKLSLFTGWNEWIAGRWTRKDGWTGDPFSFVDEFDWAHSRDIEPVKSWGDRGDVYYMQFVDRVRKFKGTEEQPKASAEKTIDINNFNAWQDVAPFFAAYKGNTVHRDSPGRNQFYYTNNSGRNDITGAKVARDANYLYFYVQTAEKLTPSTDHNWMMLFIDTDRDKATGWNGYDYIVNYKAPKDGNGLRAEELPEQVDMAGCRNRRLGG